jgi:MFS family permease
VFGVHRGMDTLGAAIGPVLALAYLYAHPADYRFLFAVAFVPGALSVGVTFLVRERRRAPAPGPRPGFFRFFAYWKQGDPVYRTVVGALTCFAVVNSSDVFLLLAVKGSGCSDTQMIGVYIVYNFVYALLAYPLGRLADRVGLRVVLGAGLVVFALVYFAVGFVQSLPAFVLLFVAYALFAACFESNAKAMVANLCRGEEAGRALGLYNSLSSLAAVVAGAWTGLVWMYAGPVWAFVISGAGALAVAVFLWSRRTALRPR